MTTANNGVVRTRQLAVGYDGAVVARVPDLDLVGGLVWHVTGPNGSGKTTLLKTLSGLLPPVSGQVERHCGMGPRGAIYVHSVPYVFAGSVRRNLQISGPDPSEIETVATELGLAPLLEREAVTLSHGQQRRLALARALVGRPAILLVDEPEGGLDEEAITAWRACAVRAVDAGTPALVVAAHRPGAFENVPTREVPL